MERKRLGGGRTLLWTFAPPEAIRNDDDDDDDDDDDMYPWMEGHACTCILWMKHHTLCFSKDLA